MAKLKAEIEAENMELLKENKKLEAKFSKMEAMLEKLLEEKESNSTTNTNVEKEVMEDDIIVPIEQNKYVKVTSLCNWQLNLTPETHGKGNPIIFHKFGQTRNITFAKLEEIVNANRKMAENGRYYIQDKNVVKLLMLEDVYDNILDENKIKAILDNKGANVLELFKLTPEKQQDLVVSMIIKKVVDGGNIDFNHLNKISEIYGKDIITKISDAKKNKEIK